MNEVVARLVILRTNLGIKAESIFTESTISGEFIPIYLANSNFHDLDQCFLK
jgi:hypothetical protein